MPAGTLVLAFAAVLGAGLLLTSAARGRSLTEVLHGITSAKPEEAQAALGANVETTVSGGGGGTAGDQKTFGEEFARLTGMNPKVVEAWLLHEQPPGSPATPGSNNWLNVQFTDQGPNSTYYAIAKLPARQAAAATVTWLRKQPGLNGILRAAGHGVNAEVTAIENSGWASSHYGNQSPNAFLAV